MSHQLDQSVWQQLLDAADAADTDTAPSEFTDARILAMARKEVSRRRTTNWLAVAAVVPLFGIGLGVWHYGSERNQEAGYVAADAGQQAPSQSSAMAKAAAGVSVTFLPESAKLTPQSLGALKDLEAMPDLCAAGLKVRGSDQLAPALRAARMSALAQQLNIAPECLAFEGSPEGRGQADSLALDMPAR
jgi:hypothetical protein